MCGRYDLGDDPVSIVKHYKVSKEQAELIHPNFNVAPTQTMPVVTNDGSGNKIELMKWGIPRFIGPGKVTEVFNTRDDKAFGSWKKLVEHKRCLIPANGYYEWKKVTENGKIVKYPFYYRPKQLSIFSFAGIWNLWKDQESGEEIKVYSIMTTSPNKEASKIHNRMPVILYPDEEAKWVSPDNNENDVVIKELLHPLADGSLEYWETDRKVNSSRINEKGLNLPLNSQ